jgi:hypothetical protein
MQQSSLGTSSESYNFIISAQPETISGPTVLLDDDFGKTFFLEGSTSYTVTIPSSVGHNGNSFNFICKTTGGSLVSITSGSDVVTIGYSESVSVVSADGGYYVNYINYVKPFFDVSMSVNQTIPDNVLTNINFDTIVNQYGTFYNPVTQTFTPKYPGNYQFNLSLTFILPAITSLVKASLYKNSGEVITSSVSYTFEFPNGRYNMTNIKGIVYMDGISDFILPKLIRTSSIHAVSQIIDQNPIFTNFQGRRISYF